MFRFDLVRFLQVVVGFLILAVLFTASSAVNAESQIYSSPIGSSPAVAKTRQATKTPKRQKTRKPKKTKTPDATVTADKTRVPKETRQARKTRRARKTRQAQKTQTASPTPTSVRNGTCVPVAARTAVADITVAQGGKLVSPDCRVRVSVPPNAVKNNLKIQLHSEAPVRGQQEVLGAFALNVITNKGTRLAHAEFDADLEIQVTYNPEALGAFKEELLDVAYFDEQAQLWIPLKATLDKENHTLTAETNHFSTFALTSVDDVLPYLPSLKDFQTSLFTGAATASYPLDLPAGIGGLKPNLALAYSSSTVDYFDSGTQASFVGTGWSLDTGYVTRDTLNKSEQTEGFFSLVLNGASYDLIPHSDGTYHTSSEQYIRIISGGNNGADPTGFTVWTKDGTKYVFGNGGNYRANWWRYTFNKTLYQQNYLWMLKSVTDRHGNVINYSYWKEWGGNCDVDGEPGGNGVPQKETPYVTAMYPDYISYNGGKTKVEFYYEARSDAAVAYPRYMCDLAPYQQSRLDEIQIKTVTTSGGAPVLVKTYELTYELASPVFTGITYTKTNTIDNGALTLKSIKTIAEDGSVLPPYSFTYTANRLGTATNGIGGLVRYAYTRKEIPNAYIGDAYSVNIPPLCTTANSIPSGCVQWGGTKRQSLNANVTIEKDCGDQNYDMQIWSTNGADAYAGHDVYPFAPGATYYVSARVQGWQKNPDIPTNARVGVAHSTSGASTLGPIVSLTHCGGLTWTPELKVNLADVASALQVRVHTTGKVRVKEVRVRKVVVEPRVVTQRQVEDGMGGVATTRYGYANGAVNDAAHSAVVVGCNGACITLRDDEKTQFRGFEIVRVGEPTNDGDCCSRVTQYQFAQDDIFKGQVKSVTVRTDSDGNIDTDGGNKYVVTTNTYLATNTVPLNQLLGTQSNFVYLDAQTVQTYDGDNVSNPKTVRTEFDYTTYGDLKVKREYDASNDLYRTTTTNYLNNNDTANGIYVVGLLNLTTVKDAANNTLSWTDNDYDAGWLGELVKVTANDGEGAFTRAEYAYDPYGQLDWSKDAKGNITTVTYDSLYKVFPAQVTTPLGTTTTTYDYRFGLPKEITDVNLGKTEFEYDVFGRKIKIWNALDEPFGAGAETQKITYTLNSTQPSKIRIQTRSDTGGSATPTYTTDWTFVDGLGRVIQSQKPSEDASQIIVTNRSYFLRGELRRVSNPIRVTASGGTYQDPVWTALDETRYEYDPIGRQTKVVKPDNTAVVTAYDHWATTVTNENGIPTVYRNDAFGRTTRVVESENGVLSYTTYVYDVMDRLVQVTDSAANVTTMTYDWLGRKRTMTDPDMGAWSYRYDDNDNLIEQTDAKAQRTCFYYDALNRLKGKTYQTNASSCPAADPNSYAATYRYDEGTNAQGKTQKGFRTSMSDTNGNSATWRYDLLGRMLVETKTIPGAPATYTTAYTYDDLNRVVTMKYPDGEIVTTVYNLQRLPEILTGYVNSAAYEASDQMKQVTFANLVATNYTYNPQTLRLATLQTGPTNNIQNFSYGYDAVGNVLNINDVLRAQNTTYTYDHLNRLKTATLAGVYAHSWTYNSIGNMLTRNDNNGNVTYQYNDAAHKHAVTQIGAQYFCYDANGNLTRRNATSSACTNGDALVYDKENKLTSITVGANTTTYAYDADGNRVKKVAGGTTTYYVGNHYEVTNGVVTKYYYFGKQRVAMRVGANTPLYLHSDHLGSTSATTNSAGTSTSSQLYYAFANVRATTGTVPTDYTFTGQKRDASAGLMYFGARYYDATSGRFISADTVAAAPFNPQALNRYSYVGNNPLRYTDPDGHCWPVCTVIAGAVIGAVIGAASVALPQLIENVQKGEPLTANIDPGEVAKAAAVGAVAGAIGGATLGVGTAVLGAGLGATIATGAVAGALSGQAARATDNVLSNEDITTGLGNPSDIATDAIVGGVTSGAGHVVGSMLKNAGAGLESVAASNMCSFRGDTLVTTENGKQAINTLKIGDRVRAYNSTSETTGNYAITAVWVHTDAVIEYVTIDGERIATTPEHPFFTLENGWTAAGKLHRDMHIRTASGYYGKVQRIEYVHQPQQMYNLTVATAHTFFVGTSQWLVHNSCPLLQAPKIQYHHIFPQAEMFASKFAARGINIDDYTVPLGRSTHLSGVHGRGGFVSFKDILLPGRWNLRWRQFFDENPNATAKEVYQFAGQLMDEFGLSGQPIVPYP